METTTAPQATLRSEPSEGWLRTLNGLDSPVWLSFLMKKVDEPPPSRLDALWAPIALNMAAISS